jgi:hypothetical protein
MEASSTRPSVKLDSHRPAVIVNGLVITTAPAVAELYAVLGEPTRVVSAGGPAPPGHRNNQIHVYDHLGVRLNEHQHTFRIQELACSFECQEPRFAFTPHSSFAGEFWIDAARLPAGGPVSSFVDRCPIPLAQHLGGNWSWSRNEFSFHVDSRGARLRSGRRSKQRMVIDVSLSWPHDPWADPPCDGVNTV